MLPALSIRMRSILATLVATLGVVIVGVLGFVWLEAEVDRSERFIDREFAASTSIAKIHAGIANTRRYEKDMFLNMAHDDQLERYRGQWRKELTGAVAELDVLQRRVDDESAALIRTMRSGLDAYAKGVEGIVSRIRVGQINDPWSANAAMEPHKADVRAADKSFEAIIERTAASAEASRAAMHAATRTATATLAVVVCIVLLCVVPFLAVNTVATIRAIGRVRTVAERIASGDLSVPVDVRGRDEAAAMMRALAAMQSSLRDVIGRVRAGIDSVSIASREIALGNTDLSRRTEQQAASLQQTSASMQRISESVRSRATDVTDAMQVVDGVCATADQGGIQVRAAVDTMRTIAESSRRIAEISRVVDGIAFQTNLLALNAAVEAARAGEQGRGFAVVADEVRTLSQRCATAAREIGALIAESGDRVDAGTRAVEGAGRVMECVVDDVRRVGGLMSGLVGTSREQADGVEQVGSAIEQLDELTQRNAALVEQSAAAALSLDEQAAALAGAIATFRLEAAVAA